MNGKYDPTKDYLAPILSKSLSARSTTLPPIYRQHKSVCMKHKKKRSRGGATADWVSRTMQHLDSSDRKAMSAEPFARHTPEIWGPLDALAEVASSAAGDIVEDRRTPVSNDCT